MYAQLLASLILILFASEVTLHDLKRSDDDDPLKVVVEQLAAKVTSLESSVQQQHAQLQAVSGGLASTYVRWGRTECAGDSEKVYSGRIGGSWYRDSGRAVNYLCLTPSPRYDSVRSPGSDYLAKLMGTEYDGIPTHHDDDAVCAVCRTPHPTTLMIPATNQCPTGWTRQYYGHLAAGRMTDVPTEYICLDAVPEEASGGQSDRDGALLFLTITECSGSLPCPPFLDNRVATCVVCSK